MYGQKAALTGDGMMEIVHGGWRNGKLLKGKWRCEVVGGQLNRAPERLEGREERWRKVDVSFASKNPV